MHVQDIVGDVKCRFRYAPVDRDDYGLSVDDILQMSDKELNQRVSLKRLATYRDRELRASVGKSSKSQPNTWSSHRELESEDATAATKTKKRKKSDKEEAKEKKSKRKVREVDSSKSALKKEQKKKKKKQLKS